MIDKNDKTEEEIWQAWVKKNEARDRLKFARRLRVLAVLVAIASLIGLLWRFA